jgi:hypothetical protein
MLTEQTVAVGELPATPTYHGTALRLVGGVVSAALLLFFLLLIYNRYLPIQEGWFSYYAYLMEHGKFPYRDFYFFTQPISLFISQVISSFGDKLIYFRYYGIVERTCLTIAVYYLLSRYFSVAATVYGTIASVFLYTSNGSDAFFSYINTCLIFLIVALIFLQAVHTRGKKWKLNLILSGVFCALSFWSKQSNGLFGAAAVAFAIAVLSPSFKTALRRWFYLALGGILISLPIVSWLWFDGAWGGYVDQVYRGAASSKGSVPKILFGFFERAFEPATLLTFAVVIGLSAQLVKKCGTGANHLTQRTAEKETFFAILTMGAAVMCGIAFVQRTGFVAINLLMLASRWLVRLVFYATVSAFVWVLWQRFVKRRIDCFKDFELPVILLLAGVFWTYSCGSSYNIGEQSAIPSLSLIIAFSYDRLTTRLQMGRKVVIATALLIVLVSMWHKWNVAFDWTSWREPVSTEGKQSHWAAIADYKLDSSTVAIYDTILDDITQNTKDGDQIVTFPFMPMFNVITRKPQPTFAAVHYWDVCPDYVAMADANRVKAVRPRMIINFEPAAWEWRIIESGFRNGRPSGQRYFQDVINGLTTSGDYRLLHAFLSPHYEDRISVWLRTR